MSFPLQNKKGYFLGKAGNSVKKFFDILSYPQLQSRQNTDHTKDMIDVIDMIVSEGSYMDIINKIIAFLKKNMSFSACSLYELNSRNKIRPIYSDANYDVILKFRQKNIFLYKDGLMRENDIVPDDDKDSIYHPIIVNHRLCYVFVFDGVKRPENKQDYFNYMNICKNLNIIMGCLHNATELRKGKYIDGLTELPNELQLRKDIERCLSLNKDYVLATIEIDDMICYNEKYGVFFGDKIVKSVANALIPLFSKNGNGLYRFLGAKFAVLIKGTQEDSFSILEAVQKHIKMIEMENIQLSSTIGAVEIQYLDKALYDVAYQKVLQAMRVEKGTICFSGEHRQLEKEKKSAEEKENNNCNAEQVLSQESIKLVNDLANSKMFEPEDDEQEVEFSDKEVYQQEQNDDDIDEMPEFWDDNNENTSNSPIQETTKQSKKRKKEKELFDMLGISY